MKVKQLIGTMALAALLAFAPAAGAAGSAKRDPGYWFNKAAICATYGNHAAAIRYFGKTIALDPNNAEAYFGMGVSYGEEGRFYEAVSRIDRALSLGGRLQDFYYGRGRVYLMGGFQVHAIQDFRTAAALGSADARGYLVRVAGVSPETFIRTEILPRP